MAAGVIRQPRRAQHVIRNVGAGIYVVSTAIPRSRDLMNSASWRPWYCPSAIPGYLVAFEVRSRSMSAPAPAGLKIRPSAGNSSISPRGKVATIALPAHQVDFVGVEPAGPLQPQARCHSSNRRV